MSRAFYNTFVPIVGMPVRARDHSLTWPFPVGTESEWVAPKFLVPSVVWRTVGHKEAGQWGPNLSRTPYDLNVTVKIYSVHCHFKSCISCCRLTWLEPCHFSFVSRHVVILSVYRVSHVTWQGLLYVLDAFVVWKFCCRLCYILTTLFIFQVRFLVWLATRPALQLLLRGRVVGFLPGYKLNCTSTSISSQKLPMLYSISFCQIFFHVSFLNKGQSGIMWL